MSKKTVKLVLDSDEWYPVFSLSEPDKSLADYEHPIDVPIALARRWEKASSLFAAIQTELKELNRKQDWENK